MKVLQICQKPPLPATDGGCIAMNNITKGLMHADVSVKVLAIETTKHPFKKEEVPADYLKQTAIETVFVNTKVKPIDAFCNLFTNQSYNIKRFYSNQFEALILQTITTSKYDVILLESLYVLPYLKAIRAATKAILIYRAHNVEFEIWERNAKVSSGLKKNYLKLLAKRLKDFEVDAIQQVDGIAAIAQKDVVQLKGLGVKVPSIVIPFGVDLSNYVLEKNERLSYVFHIGSMDWLPNVNGIEWFLREVWPSIIRENSKTEFKLAGKNMPETMLKLEQENVTVVGEVKSAIDFMAEGNIMVVPLFSGSGMRIKIIEAMALGKLVIATSVAAEGIEFIDKENISIANTANEFIEQIGYYQNNFQECNRVAKNAKELVRTNYDNQVIVNNLVKFFKQQISK